MGLQGKNLILPDSLDLGYYSASNRNEYQKQIKKTFWGVEALEPTILAF
jgi:hypothetical protein